MRIKILMLLTSVAVIGSFSGAEGKEAERRWQEYRRKQMQQQGVFDDTTPSGGEHKAVTEKKDVVLGPVVGKEGGKTFDGGKILLDDEKKPLPIFDVPVKKEEPKKKPERPVIAHGKKPIPPVLQEQVPEEDVPVKKELPVMGYLIKDKIEELPKDKQWYIDNFGETGETIFASNGDPVKRGFDPQYFFIKGLTLGNDEGKFNFNWKIITQELQSLMQMSKQRVEGDFKTQVMAGGKKDEFVERMNYKVPVGWEEKETNSKIKNVITFEKNLGIILEKAIKKLKASKRISAEAQAPYLKTLENKALFVFAASLMKEQDREAVEDRVSLREFQRQQVFEAFEAMALLHSLMQSDEDLSFSWSLPHQILNFLNHWLAQKNM